MLSIFLHHRRPPKRCQTAAGGYAILSHRVAKTGVRAAGARQNEEEMKGERRGIFLVLGVLIFSAVLGGVYGPSVRATAASTDDLKASLRNFTRVLSVVEENYAEPLATAR